jgi:hypothetical protein
MIFISICFNFWIRRSHIFFINICKGPKPKSVVGNLKFLTGDFSLCESCCEGGVGRRGLAPACEGKVWGCCGFYRVSSTLSPSRTPWAARERRERASARDILWTERRLTNLIKRSFLTWLKGGRKVVSSRSKSRPSVGPCASVLHFAAKRDSFVPLAAEKYVLRPSSHQNQRHVRMSGFAFFRRLKGIRTLVFNLCANEEIWLNSKIKKLDSWHQRQYFYQ